MSLLKDYKLKLNLKAICNYEYLSGKPYEDIGSVEDIAMLAYCILCANNEIDFTYDIFLKLLNQKKVANEVSDTINNILKVDEQFRNKKREGGNEEKAEKKEVLWMSDIANSLIAASGIDPRYVMYDMDLWELNDLAGACLDKKKGDLMEQRLWTFLEMSPLRIPKNTNGPQDIIPFSWEKEESEEKKKEEFENNAKAAMNFLNKAKKNG